MSRDGSLRTVLMAADIKASGAGFHSLVFKVDAGGRSGISQVTVLISQDAHRKLAAQMARARLRPIEPILLLKTWARWELAHRVKEHGVAPSSITITASDIDDFGAYASDLGRTLQAS